MSESTKKNDTISEETKIKLRQLALKKPAEELADENSEAFNTLNAFLSITVKSQVSAYKKIAEENHVFQTWLFEILAKMEFAAAAYAGDDNEYKELHKQPDEVLALYGRLFFELISQTDRRMAAYSQLEEEQLQKEAQKKASN